ncbi:MAG TPA: hypothetical protein G4O11_03020 [Anaerolineae bacterium]|nr:hypothetical protein [Anaerolineae bacterium]
MIKIDFKREWKHLYQPSSKDFEIVDVPSMNFTMIDGQGDPNTAQEYQEALETLYAVAYKLKFMSKRELGRDYVVPPLEGLWWAEDMDVFTTAEDRNAWQWTMMIMQPDWVTEELFEQACSQVGETKDPAAISKIRLECYHEGLAVQIMHIGPYSEEGPTIHKLHHEFLPENGYREAGKHHEIYLSDPRNVAPEKLKTVLRQPVRKTG